jgi:hypothetical protein
MWTLMILIVAINVILIGGMVLIYLWRRRHEKLVCDLDEFCAELSKDFHNKDPHVLVNSKWVNRYPPDSPKSG